MFRDIRLANIFLKIKKLINDPLKPPNTKKSKESTSELMLKTKTVQKY